MSSCIECMRNSVFCHLVYIAAAMLRQSNSHTPHLFTFFTFRRECNPLAHTSCTRYPIIKYIYISSNSLTGDLVVPSRSISLSAKSPPAFLSTVAFCLDQFNTLPKTPLATRPISICQSKRCAARLAGRQDPKTPTSIDAKDVKEPTTARKYARK
jgi:hypothetical protein